MLDCARHIWPLVALSQPINTLAFAVRLSARPLRPSPSCPGFHALQRMLAWLPLHCLHQGTLRDVFAFFAFFRPLRSPFPCLQPLLWPSCAWQVDGLLFGANEFSTCTLVMVGASVPAAALMLTAATSANSLVGLRRIWFGLSLLMLLRSAIGIARIRSSTGPWEALKSAA